MNKKKKTQASDNSQIFDFLQAYATTIIIVVVVIAVIVVVLFTMRSFQQTSDALLTQQAQSDAQAQTIAALETQRSVEKMTQTQAAIKTFTPTASTTSLPTATSKTSTPAATVTAQYYDKVTYIADITIPDGVSIPEGTKFTKTWMVKNDGFYTWDSTYEIVWIGGDQMDSPVSKPLISSGVVRPGENALISVDLVAPPDGRKYTGFWKIRAPYGSMLGVGDDGSRALYAVINTAPYYSFIDNLCNATWSNGNSLLYCPSKEFDTKGYFISKTNVRMENNLVLPQNTLIMSPQQVDNGQIVARFKPVVIPHDGHFKSRMGCVVGKPECNVKVTIKYSVGGGAEIDLVEINEYYDGFVSDIDIKFADYGLVGESVALSFYVDTNGGYEDDLIFWWEPRLEP